MEEMEGVIPRLQPLTHMVFTPCDYQNLGINFSGVKKELLSVGESGEDLQLSAPCILKSITSPAAHDGDHDFWAET